MAPHSTPGHAAASPYNSTGLVVHDADLLPAIYACLTVRSVKATVILRVFDIVTSFLEFAEEDGGKERTSGARSYSRASTRS